jgi:hypothetical protein
MESYITFAWYYNTSWDNEFETYTINYEIK